LLALKPRLGGERASAVAKAMADKMVDKMVDRHGRHEDFQSVLSQSRKSLIFL